MTLERAHEAGLAAIAGHDVAALPGALRRVEETSLRAMAAVLPSTGVAARHAWLVDRWRAALEGEPDIEPDGGAPGPEFEDAYATLGFPPAMARFHRAALARLSGLLADEVDVRQLLFGDADVLTALAAYQDNVFTGYLNAASADLVRQAADATPYPLRVLELGGGAGLCTAAALAALRGARYEYLFTDVSRLFTVAAARRFAEHPGVDHALLDIDTDFAAQGREAGSADVVLAGNVLHNATHVGRALERIRWLLAPGGSLVFTESTRENHAILTSMQFLLSPEPGRARLGSDDRRGPAGAVFVDEAGWCAELTGAGFTPPRTLPDPESPLAVAGQQLFWSRRVE
ncbi:class I SAM-dependent methyltransferase [Amycolatopsis cihanbeyliensis]|uniref:Methyltransferase family protein n=1 Tax=Amycolatopsis cihanbeyliensis TaxID=1128664 RepID=A0A542DBV2_AMYCI|nr:class I SAM-dependent methyltransferase [Amycolatopsis cihanbeyliensis]TQJ00544.1 methyltransferase family protein [Amycolatopsis cihanbeyliensis]